jgi:hypothetical protein
MQPCDWEVIDCDDCTALTSLSDELQEAVRQHAVNRLWEWTNRRFGACPVSYRPCKKSCATDSGWMWNYPIAGGRYIDLGCGNCSHGCSCRSVSEIILPGPIAEPTEILIDGEELDLCSVRVDNYNRLVRIDGGEWPKCQNLGEPPTEEGTWQVTYLKGEPVPAGGGFIAGILACEYAKGICKDNSCRLPKRVSTVQRQGLTVAILDNFQNLGVGGTGIWEIDDFITTYTTNLRMGPWQASSVSSPDLTPQRFTTWECSES